MSNYQTCSYDFGHVSIVVHRPVLDEKERKKREETLRRAIASCGKALQIAEQQKKMEA